MPYLNDFERSLLEANDNQFEKALESLSMSIDTLKMKGAPSPSPITNLEATHHNIKTHFLLAVLNAHPRKRDFLACPDVLRFQWVLNNFDSIFTLNYDLLMYWAFHGEWGPYRDGFSASGDDLMWGRNRHRQNVFNLHGGLHFRIMFDEGWLYKLRSSEFRDTQALINSGRCHVVSECSAILKDKHIESDDSQYLTFCKNHLAQKFGIIVTYGASFLNDEHILCYLLHNPRRWKAIYFGIYKLHETGFAHVLLGKVHEWCRRQGIDVSDLPDITFFESANTSFG